jgi:hypothetical protein
VSDLRLQRARSHPAKNRRKKPTTTNSTDILIVAEQGGEYGSKKGDRLAPLALFEKPLRERTIASGDGPRVNDDPDVQGGMR